MLRSSALRLFAGLLALAWTFGAVQCHTDQIFAPTISTDWDPSIPMHQGDLVNITFYGFEEYDHVLVTVRDADYPDRFAMVDASGRLGTVRMRIPEFMDNTPLQFDVEAIRSLGSPERWETPMAVDPQIYRFKTVVRASMPSVFQRQSLNARSPPPGAYVQLQGSPSFVRRGQMITALWGGYPSGHQVELRLICPIGQQVLSCVDSALGSITFLVDLSFTAPQMGCYMQIAQGDNDANGICMVDYSTSLSSSTFFMLR